MTRNSTVPKALMVDGLAVAIRGKFLKTATVRDEPYECVRDAGAFLAGARTGLPGVDLLTFMQGIADEVPRHPYYHEWESLAVIPVTTYDDWWKKQIKDKTRNIIRKAAKSGVETVAADLNDEFVRGVKEIYDESPTRQGKPFKHYQKPFEVVKAELATFPERSVFLGAYHQGALIGFAKFVTSERAASLMHIIAKVAERSKAPTNALIAKAVELCAQRQIPFLHYGVWSVGGLGQFKENHAFVRRQIPRYYLPLTGKGSLGLRLGLHRRITERLPEGLREKLVGWRQRWQARQSGSTATGPAPALAGTNRG